jgi:hypothetical protein
VVGERKKHATQTRSISEKAAVNDLSQMILRTHALNEIGDTGLFRLSYFRWVWEPQSLHEVSVATKADDAAVDRSLWAVGGDGAGMENARELMRRFLFRCWYDRLSREARTYLSLRKPVASEAEFLLDQKGIEDCLLRSKRATWWDWADGSRLYFWRWPDCWQKEARDGVKACHVSWPDRRPIARKISAEAEWHQNLIDEKVEKLIW